MTTTSPSTSSIWRDIPKIELHVHLEGAAKFDTVIEEHKRRRLRLPAGDETAWRKHFLLTEPADSLNGFLKIMENARDIFRYPEVITRVTKECIVDKANDNVKLLELRYAPHYFTDVQGSQLSLKSVHEAVQQGVALGVKEAVEAGFDIHVGLICEAYTNMPEKDFQDTVDFAIRHKAEIVGFGVAGPEIDKTAFKPFLDQIHQAGINITIHASEDRKLGKPHCALDAINVLHAKRIAHGIQIHQDREIYETMKAKRIHLEVAPTSNILTNSVDDIQHHPVAAFLRDGVNFSVSTDDPRTFDTTLSGEYEMLHGQLGFTVADFYRINRNALEASFLPDEIKHTVVQKYFTATAEEKFCRSHIS